jgi:hypothetical protein
MQPGEGSIDQVGQTFLFIGFLAGGTWKVVYSRRIVERSEHVEVGR